MKLDRRSFVGLGSAALVGLSLKSDRPIDGSFVNDSSQAGHSLRDHASFPSPRRTEKIPLVIVGGGIAGLSAAWRLRKRGFTDFVLLEMNDQAGGNARYGENAITAYPWAAHYVPVPSPKAVYVRELFEDLGVLKNGQWDERYLCFSPKERLFLYGRWQDGIEPSVGLKETDREQFQKLEGLFAKYRASGEFTIPMELGRSAKFSDLDRISFADWLQQQGIDSKLVLWYMNYACRDDYGALAASTSAWAGIHYFSSREPDEKGPLTWPEGNGWITRRLLERVGENVRTNQMVHRIVQTPRGLSTFSGDTEFQSEFVIFAAPTFLAPYLIPDFPRLARFRLFSMAHGQSHFRAAPRLTRSRTDMGHRFPRLANAGLRRRHASERSFAHRPHSLDILLGASRWHTLRQSPPAIGKRLELLEGSDSPRSRTRAHRHPPMRFAHGHHAHGARHDSPVSRLDLFI